MLPFDEQNCVIEKSSLRGATEDVEFLGVFLVKVRDYAAHSLHNFFCSTTNCFQLFGRICRCKQQNNQK